MKHIYAYILLRNKITGAFITKVLKLGKPNSYSTHVCMKHIYAHILLRNKITGGFITEVLKMTKPNDTIIIVN